MKFNIVVPVFNCEKWIRKCLYSIQTQTYKNFNVIVYNDASTDSTSTQIDQHFLQFPDPRFKVIHNTFNRKALHNIVEGFNLLKTAEDPESVLMVIDGDDYLFCEYSLEFVANVYHRSNCLLTYGSFIQWPTGELSFDRQFPRDVIENNSYRDYKFISSHLRTFKSKLWNAIKDQDLRDEDGTYFKTGWDVAFMIPMLEMANGNFQYIKNILYVYNRWNPISDDVINSADQGRVDQLIRTRKQYEKLV